VKIELYTTTGCHLCEEALSLLHQAQRDGHTFKICEVEIADSEYLIDTYGIRIPVIRSDDTRELNWPFSYSQLLDFIMF